MSETEFSMGLHIIISTSSFHLHFFTIEVYTKNRKENQKKIERKNISVPEGYILNERGTFSSCVAEVYECIND